MCPCVPEMLITPVHGAVLYRYTVTPMTSHIQWSRDLFVKNGLVVGRIDHTF